MRVRWLVVAMGVGALVAPAGVRAAGPVTAGGFGVVTMSGYPCPRQNLGIDFVWDGGANFLAQTGYFPTQDNATRTECAGVYMWNQFTNISAVTATPCEASGLYEYQTKPDTMSVGGTNHDVYTFRNTFRFCNGVINNQTTVVTINPKTIVFSHNNHYSDGRPDLHAGGTLMRLW